MIVIGINLIL